MSRQYHPRQTKHIGLVRLRGVLENVMSRYEEMCSTFITVCAGRSDEEILDAIRTDEAIRNLYHARQSAAHSLEVLQRAERDIVAQEVVVDYDDARIVLEDIYQRRQEAAGVTP